MDVFYLTPISGNSPALRALSLPENATRVGHKTPPRSSGAGLEAVVPCLCLIVHVEKQTVDRKSSWLFTIGADPQANIFLPMARPRDRVTASFTFFKPDGAAGDHASLVPVTSGRSATRQPILDQIDEREIRYKGADVATNMHHFHKTSVLNIGSYSFDVHFPSRSIVESVNAARVQRGIAGTLPINVLDFQWRDTGAYSGRGTHGRRALVRSTSTGFFGAVQDTERLSKDVRKEDNLYKDVAIMTRLSHPGILSLISLQRKQNVKGSEGTVRILTSPWHGTWKDILETDLQWALAGKYNQAIRSIGVYLKSYDIQYPDIRPEDVLFWVPDLGDMGLQSVLENIARIPDLEVHFYLSNFGRAYFWGGMCILEALPACNYVEHAVELGDEPAESGSAQLSEELLLTAPQDSSEWS